MQSSDGHWRSRDRIRACNAIMPTAGSGSRSWRRVMISTTNSTTSSCETAISSFISAPPPVVLRGALPLRRISGNVPAPAGRHRAACASRLFAAVRRCTKSHTGRERSLAGRSLQVRLLYGGSVLFDLLLTRAEICLLLGRELAFQIAEE